MEFKKLYFIANENGVILTSPYVSKENLLAEHSVDEGEKLVEINEGEDGFDELLKMV